MKISDEDKDDIAKGTAKHLVDSGLVGSCNIGLEQSHAARLRNWCHLVDVACDKAVTILVGIALTGLAALALSGLGLWIVKTAMAKG